MKGLNKFFAVLGCVVAFTAAVAAVVAALNFLQKKKEDEELEEYLDCSIQ